MSARSVRSRARAWYVKRISSRWHIDNLDDRLSVITSVRVRHRNRLPRFLARASPGARAGSVCKNQTRLENDNRAEAYGSTSADWAELYDHIARRPAEVRVRTR